jgi:hypothetical protein
MRRQAREAHPGEYEREEIEAADGTPWRFVVTRVTTLRGLARV